MFFSKRRKFYFGIQITLIRDWEGLKFFAFFRLLNFRRKIEWTVKESQELKESQKDQSYRTPKADFVTDLVEPPSGKIVEPEDISG